MPHLRFLWPAGITACLASAAAALPSRTATVRDSIERAVFVGDPQTGKAEARFSPDGRRFFVVTQHGDLSSDRLEATLWLFDAGAVETSLASDAGSPATSPRSLAKMATSSNDDPITEARWSADGQSIGFLGRNRDAERHLFVVGVADGRLHQVTPDGQDVTGFDASREGFVFTTVPPVTDAALYESAGPGLPDVQIGTGASLFTLLYPEWENFTFGARPKKLWQFRNGKASPVVDSKTSTPIALVSETYLAVLSVAPSGRYAVVTNAAAHVPPSWETLQPAYESSFSKITADQPGVEPKIDFYRPVQYELVDLETGTRRVLVDAPLGRNSGYYDAPRAVWSPDEKRVALAGTFLPPDGPAGRSRARRPCVVVAEPASSQLECVKESAPVDPNKLYDSQLSGLEWRSGKRELLLRYTTGRSGVPPPPELYRKRGAQWQRASDSDAAAAAGQGTRRGFSIEVRQSVNEPPVLMATDARSGRSRAIWDPNPRLKEIRLGEASVYRWKDKAGREWTGGLVKPPDYAAGRRYPLVIQTHGFDPQEFLMDGVFTTANSARALAARGLVVLQVGEITTDVLGKPKEPSENGSWGYLAAIDQLDSEKLIDRQRVGLIGFSRTGWYVLDSLIHSPGSFAAATLAECTYESYGEYILNADYLGPQRAKGIAEGIGPEPFGEGLKTWLSDSPGFNTDKIRVPVLFQFHSPPSMIYGWDIYAAMRLQGKPVELLYFRNGAHILTKPSERLLSQQMNVDWFDFWLNGHEDPDRAKTAQYARWRGLRESPKGTR